MQLGRIVEAEITEFLLEFVTLVETGGPALFKQLGTDAMGVFLLRQD